jgi:ribosomal protein S21
MVVVTKKRGETKETLFRKFTRAVMEEEIVDDIRSRQYYLKPSLKIKADLKLRLKKKAQKRRGMLKRARAK